MIMMMDRTTMSQSGVIWIPMYAVPTSDSPKFTIWPRLAAHHRRSAHSRGLFPTKNMLLADLFSLGE